MDRKLLQLPVVCLLVPVCGLMRMTMTFLVPPFISLPDTNPSAGLLRKIPKKSDSDTNAASCKDHQGSCSLSGLQETESGASFQKARSLTASAVIDLERQAGRWAWRSKPAPFGRTVAKLKSARSVSHSKRRPLQQESLKLSEQLAQMYQYPKREIQRACMQIGRVNIPRSWRCFCKRLPFIHRAPNQREMADLP